MADRSEPGEPSRLPTGHGWDYSRAPLAEAFDVALLDLDGVVYVGKDAVPHAAETLRRVAAEHAMSAAFVTNNAARTPAVVAAHLQRLGIPAEPADVVTSAQAGARVLAELVAPGSRVLYIGGDGVPVALRERGFEPVVSIGDQPAALIQGYGRNVGWEQLAQGCYALQRGLPWVATNMDRTIPTPLGRALGNGAMVTALKHATGAVPIVAGKPEPPLMLESVERSGALRPLVVGDRLDTDIEGANRSGIASILVLTGVTDWPELLAANPLHRPSFIGVDLRALKVGHPQVQIDVSETQIAARCRGMQVVASRAGSGSTGDPVEGPGGRGLKPPHWARDLLGLQPAVPEHLDAIRCGCAIAWLAADSGWVLADCAVRSLPAD